MKLYRATRPLGGSFRFSSKTPLVDLEVAVITNAPARVVIIANGHLSNPAEARRRIRPGDHIICADGGTRHVHAMGLTPDVVVGDMDSLDPGLRTELEAIGVRFEVFPTRKDETDLELALQLAIAEGAEDIEILAMLGGRLDQSLANLLLLARSEWASAWVRVTEGNQTAWPVRGSQEATIKGICGDLLSLVPLTPLVTGVTLEGVEWPLNDATLRFGSTLTLSNALTAPTARLRVEDGLVLVVHQSTDREEEIQ